MEDSYRARELFYEYHGNRFYMDHDGAGREYDSYRVSKETEEKWAEEYVSGFLGSNPRGKEARWGYSTAADLIKHCGSGQDWNACLYYPLRTRHLDDVSILYMLSDSFKMAERAAKKKCFSEEDAAEYLQELDSYARQVQARAENGTLTRAEDYVLQEFSDPAVVSEHLSGLRKKWEGLFSRKYYAAYEERYRTVHEKGVSWSSDRATPIVMDVIKRYGITPSQHILEIGCGEGRDAKAVLDAGYDLTATDISREAIAFCRKIMPEHSSHFRVLDCLSDELNEKFDLIYAVAVVHMLVLDADRDGFYRFIYGHLSPGGSALICSMGDGETEMESDIETAFDISEREHSSGKMMVATTSCRMVSFSTFENELARNGLEITEKGITGSLPDFDSLMYAVVRRR